MRSSLFAAVVRLETVLTQPSLRPKVIYHHVGWGLPINFTSRSKPMAKNFGLKQVKPDPDEVLLAFVLTNGGRGFVSMEKVLENADNPKGFWLDLQVGARTSVLRSLRVPLLCSRQLPSFRSDSS